MIITIHTKFPEVDSTFKVKAEGLDFITFGECRVKIHPNQVVLAGFDKLAVEASTQEDGYVYLPLVTTHSYVKIH